MSIFSKKADYGELLAEKNKLNEEKVKLQNELEQVVNEIKKVIVNAGDTRPLRERRLDLEERIIRLDLLVTDITAKLAEAEPAHINAQIKALQAESDKASKQASKLWEQREQARRDYYDLDEQIRGEREIHHNLIHRNREQIAQLQARLDELGDQ